MSELIGLLYALLFLLVGVVGVCLIMFVGAFFVHAFTCIIEKQMQKGKRNER